jgi:hypothetical protein
MKEREKRNKPQTRKSNSVGGIFYFSHRTAFGAADGDVGRNIGRGVV